MSDSDPDDAELLALFLLGQQTFGERVAAIRDDQWSLPTPCRDWDVAALVGHLVDEHRWAPPLLHGHDLDAAGDIAAGTRDFPVDGGVGGNLAEAWVAAAAGSADAFSEDGALKRTVSLSRGATGAVQYAREMTFDLLVHSWDLGRATGDDRPIPEALVPFGQAMAQETGSESGNDYFGPAVEIPGNSSPLDALLAMTGRDPR